MKSFREAVIDKNKTKGKPKKTSVHKTSKIEVKDVKVWYDDFMAIKGINYILNIILL